MSPRLFEPGGSIYGTRSSTIAHTEQQRLRAHLNAAKAQAPKCDGIDVEESVLRHEGQTYLLPEDFVVALKSGKLRRTDASPQLVLELIDSPVEETLLQRVTTGQPKYWLHVPQSDGSIAAWPVYGYVADYGYGYATTPVVTGAAPGWDTAEWLCRCAQCGRELPPSFYFINTNGRPKGICRACTSTNIIVDKIWNKMHKYGIHFLSDEELKLLDDMAWWYDALWHRNLLPRGDYCSHIIGEEAIQERINTAIKHRRGSTPRGPGHTKHSKISEIYALIDDSVVTREEMDNL